MILFLRGPDTFRLRHKLKEIREQYQSRYPRAVEVREFDCLEADLQDAKTALETISMFERKKFLVFHNVFQKNSFETFFAERKKQLAESAHHVVVLVEEGEIKAKTTNSFYQWLKRNVRQQEFLPLSPAKLKAWVEQEFQRYGLKATPGVQEALAREAGNDLWRLSGEVRKLAAWKKSAADAQVRQADIALFVRPRAQADVFATIDAIARKNKKEGLALLYRHFQKGDSPFYLCTMLAYQFRTILQICDMAQRKLSYAAMLQQTALHPYVLKKGLRVARHFSLPELKALYERLFTADKNLKTGKGEPEAAFDLLIATL